jgi:hypothetical protein
MQYLNVDDLIPRIDTVELERRKREQEQKDVQSC